MLFITAAFDPSSFKRKPTLYFASRYSMENEEAVRRLQQGGVLIVPDLPVGTEFGLDYCSWRTAARFRGVKMLPPGLHLIFTG